MPFAWMDAAHQWLGLGPLPDAPIVAYLARSTSAFYAMSGGLMWAVASDLRRYARLVRWLGLVTIAFGCALVAIDWTAGLPSYWTLTEGPFGILYGLVIYFASDASQPADRGPDDSQRIPAYAPPGYHTFSQVPVSADL